MKTLSYVRLSISVNNCRWTPVGERPSFANNSFVAVAQASLNQRGKGTTGGDTFWNEEMDNQDEEELKKK